MNADTVWVITRTDDETDDFAEIVAVIPGEYDIANVLIVMRHDAAKAFGSPVEPGEETEEFGKAWLEDLEVAADEAAFSTQGLTWHVTREEVTRP